ncbi:MAG: hypothetical protein OIF50_15285 [Flavobacteriaceae bacterium]|nr:hypothetical protein [Flavobacteriaceae bacterium]
MNKHKFSFLSPLHLMKQMSHNLNRIIDHINDAENSMTVSYDFKEALEEYNRMKPECLDEFCANYSFGYCLLHKELDSPENREKMYQTLKQQIIKHQKAS